MELIKDLGKIIFFLFLLLSIFLITARSKRKLPDYLFAAYLLVTLIDFSGFFLSPNDTKIFQGAKIASVLLQMPIYYLYVHSACYYNFRLQKKQLLHGLPFLISICFFGTVGLNQQSYQIFNVVSVSQYYCYIVAVFLALGNFKKLYLANHSSNHHLTHRWLMQMTTLFLIGNFFVLIREFVGHSSPILVYLYAFTSLYVLFLISWFVLNALYRPNLFAGISIDLVPIELENEFEEAPEQLGMLLKFMETEKPYLDDRLTLQKLAEQIGLPEKQLSLLINQHAGKHFFDFINKYRIEDAQALLKQDHRLTVLEVLYQVGFNSKSSFYTAFKKETNLTPTDYRKSID